MKNGPRVRPVPTSSSPFAYRTRTSAPDVQAHMGGQHIEGLVARAIVALCVSVISDPLTRISRCLYRKPSRLSTPGCESGDGGAI